MFNLRDLGGYAASDGTVRCGLVFRSNALVGLDEREQGTLEQLGIRCAIDLREHGERNAEPTNLGGAIQEHHHPIIELTPDDQIPTDLAESTIWTLTQRARQITNAIALLSRSPKPAVFFCSTGKDRTGLISALILSALGVSDGDVASDYARTEQLIPDDYRPKAIARARAAGLTSALPPTWLAAPATLMLDIVQRLHTAHGGAAQYLLANGLERHDLDRLRATLVA